jgi:hypothetical protein
MLLGLAWRQFGWSPSRWLQIWEGWMCGPRRMHENGCLIIYKTNNKTRIPILLMLIVFVTYCICLNEIFDCMNFITKEIIEYFVHCRWQNSLQIRNELVLVSIIELSHITSCNGQHRIDIRWRAEQNSLTVTFVGLDLKSTPILTPEDSGVRTFSVYNPPS